MPRNAIRPILLCALPALCCATFAAAEPTADSLQARLLAEPAEQLAAAARSEGDALRGAVLFHQRHLTCLQCHGMVDAPGALGPDLTRLPAETEDAHLVRSILEPSRTIHDDFRAVTLLTHEGRSLTGIEAGSDERTVRLREASGDGEPVEIPRESIDEIIPSPVSIMPEGLADQLAGREEFLDLVRYLIELRDGGAPRARLLQPPPELYAEIVLPEYEARVDHARLIGEWDADSLRRGREIYLRSCVNCHGTVDQPGSLPTSTRFAGGTFKQGGDPLSMYNTLTRGYGLMAAQPWMVPRQKYDVIHYIRETFLKPHNPDRYTAITPDYLQGLPPGDTLGPEPVDHRPWTAADYGPNLNLTLETGSGGSNIAFKGIAVRVDGGPGGVARGRHWMVFEHDTLRMAAAYSGQGFIDWNCIHFNGRHGVHPATVGEVAFQNKNGLGWGNPADGGFDDPRLQGRDGRHYGPLPEDRGRFRGLYHHGQQVILSYTVGQAEVLEMPGLWEPAAGDSPPQAVFTRTFQIGPRPHALLLQVAEVASPEAHFAAADPQAADREGTGPESAAAVSLAGHVAGLQGAGLQGTGLQGEAFDHRWRREGNRLLLSIPAGERPLRFVLWQSAAAEAEHAALARTAAESAPPPADLSRLISGGPARWPQVLQTEANIGDEQGPFAVDVLSLPENNPWHCQMRPTGLDFFDDGRRMAVCTWDGDVWIVSGIDDAAAGLQWRRIAAGLFQPLGLRIVEGQIFVTCRDQLVRLHDLNGNGEIDFYENFNSDHQVTEHFHEFAMGLQTDDEGNFYYAKSARHALPPLVPHHGTLLKVSADGSRTEILADGFRAANGVCLNDDGTFFVTDQEGHWTPKNRINWVRRGGFYGNMWSYTDVTDNSDEAMRQPLCWITNAFDRSPAELLWVRSKQWGPLDGALLNLSYGYGRVFVVPHERIGDEKQGGMVALPIPDFPTGLVRGRFHPGDGQLYLAGMFAWAGSRQHPGGLYRLRATGRPVHLPIGLEAVPGTLRLTFSGPLDPESIKPPGNYSVKVWSLQRSSRYGSAHHDERELEVTAGELSSDGRTLSLSIPEIGPTWSMEVRYAVESAEGSPVVGTLHNTIHKLGE